MMEVAHSSSKEVEDLFRVLKIPYHNCCELKIQFTAGEVVTVNASFILNKGQLVELKGILQKEKITAKIQDDDTK